MLQGVQPDASSNGGRIRTRGKNNFDLRWVNGAHTFDWGAVRIRGVDGHTQLGCGVGGGEEDVLLQAALRRKGRRETAISYVTRFDDGDGGLGDARIVDVGESENGDDPGGVHRGSG